MCQVMAESFARSFAMVEGIACSDYSSDLSGEEAEIRRVSSLAPISLIDKLCGTV